MDFHCFVSIIVLYSFCSANSAEPINYKPEELLLKVLLSTQERLQNPYMIPSERFNILRNLEAKYQKIPKSISANIQVEPIKSEIIKETEELDQVEEQSNNDLVKGINLMADRNETLDQVIDNVLETNTKT